MIWRSPPCANSPSASVVGVDFAGEMLRLAARKVASLGLQRSIRVVRGDGTSIPLASDSAMPRRSASASATSSSRVPRSRSSRACCGRAGGLRSSSSASRASPGSGRCTPGTSATSCRSSARWSRSTRAPIRTCRRRSGAFRRRSSFAALIADTGFSQVQAVPLTFGIVYLYVAERADADACALQLPTSQVPTPQRRVLPQLVKPRLGNPELRSWDLTAAAAEAKSPAARYNRLTH